MKRTTARATLAALAVAAATIAASAQADAAPPAPATLLVFVMPFTVDEDPFDVPFSERFPQTLGSTECGWIQRDWLKPGFPDPTAESSPGGVELVRNELRGFVEFAEVLKITTGCPTTTQPAPTTTQPSPTTTQPSPTTTQPSPTTTQPAPTTTQPAPTTTQPAPSDYPPAPTTTQPSPTTTQPAPSDYPPAPRPPQPDTKVELGEWTATEPIDCDTVEVHETRTHQTTSFVWNGEQWARSIVRSTQHRDRTIFDSERPVCAIGDPLDETLPVTGANSGALTLAALALALGLTLTLTARRRQA